MFIMLKLAFRMSKKKHFKCQNWRLTFIKWTPVQLDMISADRFIFLIAVSNPKNQFFYLFTFFLG